MSAAMLCGAASDTDAGASADTALALVDPHIGVIGPGSTMLGPSLPFGSIHPGPDTADGGNNGYRADRPIRGFSQLHVSGTGWSQYGNLLLSPQIGLSTAADGHDSDQRDEHASPHEYQVTLARYGIAVRLAPTAHAA